MWVIKRWNIGLGDWEQLRGSYPTRVEAEKEMERLTHQDPYGRYKVEPQE